jgi:hypothetical protein
MGLRLWDHAGRLGKLWPQLVDALQGWALCLLRCHDKPLAKKALQEAIRVRQLKVPRTHPPTACTYTATHL